MLRSLQRCRAAHTNQRKLVGGRRTCKSLAKPGASSRFWFLRNSNECPKCSCRTIASFHDERLGESSALVDTEHQLDAIRLQKQQETLSDNASRATWVKLDRQEREIASTLERLRNDCSIRSYVCSRCGYAESYLMNPKLLTDERLIKERKIELVRKGESAGPFR